MALTPKLDALNLKIHGGFIEDVYKVDEGLSGEPGVRVRTVALEMIELLKTIRKEVISIRRSKRDNKS